MRSEVICINEMMRGKDGLPAQTASIVRSLRRIRWRCVRDIGVAETWHTHGAIVSACSGPIETRDFVTKVFRGNEVMQVRIRSLIEKRRNLIATRNGLAC